MAMAGLPVEIGGNNDKHARELLDVVNLFILVTDLYGLIHMTRDITKRMK